MQQQCPKLAYTIREFGNAIGISHTTIYELIAAGKLATFKLGRRRFISVDAGRRFIAARELAEK